MHNARSQEIRNGWSIPEGARRTSKDDFQEGADRSQPPPSTGVIRPIARKAVPGPAPRWFLKGGYALELRYQAARSTVDINLTVQSIAVSAGEDQNQIVREMLQNAADVSLGGWFDFTFEAPIMDLTVAPYGGARYPVEARMDERISSDPCRPVGLGHGCA
uniref:Uncharacterized protein n=1 Tax=Solibacter usitatus (strain Ellin6076) TaxID=234267 RepID=Q02CE3_SOLUE